MSLLTDALEYQNNGYSVVPAATNGTKAPAIAWKQYTTQPADANQITTWFHNSQYDGLGLICGTVSGNLEMFEVEGRALHMVAELSTLMTDNGYQDLWARLCVGYLEQSPSGGMHWLMRVDGPARPNTKLARRPGGLDPTTGRPIVDVLIETRGEGGFTVAAPSTGRTHPTGKAWTRITGTPATIPTISIDERDALHAIATMLDQMPADQPAPPATDPFNTGLPSPPVAAGTRPGDDYNQRTSWDEILGTRGWTVTKRFTGGTLGWTRPGKTARGGISATTGATVEDRLYVFSSSTEFDTEKPYNKFAAYTLLEHNGNYTEAASVLAKAGYGTQAGEPVRTVDLEARAEKAGPPSPPAGEQAAPAERPELDVSNTAVMAEWLRTYAGTGHLSGMFLRGQDIIHTPRLGQDGYTPATTRTTDDDGPAQVRVVKKSTLASRVQYAFDCFKWVKRDGDLVKTPGIFPVDAARVASDAPDLLTGLRNLAGVIHAPVLRADGSILNTPGYDEATQLLYLPNQDLQVPTVADHPNDEEIAVAVALLDEMTDGFPFVTENDRANYYGLLLTPILRVIAPSPYKLIAITAPQPGSGKTLLASTARAIHGGVFRAEFPEDDAELRKQITSILTVTTGQLVHIDNVSGTLRSSTLAGLLTSATWGDRVLGATEWAAAPNDRVWVITGNNILLGGDLERRSLWINIDPRMPHPENRTGFAIGDLERWAADNRGRLLHALLTMARAWQVAGQPVGAQRSSDGYSRWIEVVSGILEHAGVPGTFAHDDNASDLSAGADDDEWGDFLAAAHDAMGDESWSVKELLAKVDTTTRFDPWTERGDLPLKLAMLPADLADKAMRPSGVQGIARSLGMWLRNRQGRWAGDYTVRLANTGHARERFWKIERAPRHLQPIGDSGDSGDSALGSRITNFTENGDKGVSGDSGFLPYAGEKIDLSYENGPEPQPPETPLSPRTLEAQEDAEA